MNCLNPQGIYLSVTLIIRMVKCSLHSIFNTIIIFLLIFTLPLKADENPPEITLSKEQIKTAGIHVQTLSLSNIEETLQTTGEVRANGYSASLVTPRIPSVVIKRLVKLGEKLKKSQPLIILFSTEMAEAQSRFINISQEWARVQKLGKDIVSSKRRIKVETEYYQILAQLKAYGMSEKDTNALRRRKFLQNPGEYRLYSPQEGTVTTDNFLVGAMIPSGRVLFEINNEKTVWIESPLSFRQFDLAFKAKRVIIKSDHYHGEARIVTAHEKNDPLTRLRKIRLVVDNPDHQLHAGQFVDVRFIIPAQKQGFSVPKNAVLKSSDGDWQIFIQDDDGGFIPREITITHTSEDSYTIKGVISGEKIVVSGSFFIMSELVKSGFQTHNH